MNKVISLVFVFTVALFAVNDLYGKDVYTEGDPLSKGWQVFGAMSTHPNDPLLLLVGDTFALKKPSDNANVVLFKPINLRNSEWKSAVDSNGTITFHKFEKNRPDGSGPVNYLCNKGVGLGGLKHLIVISPQVSHPDQIAIQWMHNENDKKCDDIVLPSHGGLAHAHAVR